MKKFIKINSNAKPFEEPPNVSMQPQSEIDSDTARNTSYRYVIQKTNEIIKSTLDKFMTTLTYKMGKEFQLLIDTNKLKNPKSKNLNDLNRKDFFNAIEGVYSIWFKKIVEAEIIREKRLRDGGFILFINETYILDGDQFKYIIEGLLTLPNLLIELYVAHKDGAKFYFDKILNYDDRLLTFASKLHNEIFRAKGKIEGLERALINNQEEQAKKITDMVESYTKACDSFKSDKPTYKMLKELTGISEDIWKQRLSDSNFLYSLTKELESKIKLAKKAETKSFWMGALTLINNKFNNSLTKTKEKKIKYNDDIDYSEQPKKRKKINTDDR